MSLEAQIKNFESFHINPDEIENEKHRDNKQINLCGMPHVSTPYGFGGIGKNALVRRLYS